MLTLRKQDFGNLCRTMVNNFNYKEDVLLSVSRVSFSFYGVYSFELKTIPSSFRRENRAG